MYKKLKRWTLIDPSKRTFACKGNKINWEYDKSALERKAFGLVVVDADEFAKAG